MKRIDLHAQPPEPVSHNPAIAKTVLLRLGDLPHLTTFAQARFGPGQVAPAHVRQDMSEVFFVESGQGEIRVDGQPHALTPGVCVAVEAGEAHELCNTGTEPLVVTYFGLRSP